MLRNEIEDQGRFLFRWRSYLPLLLVPFGFLALPEGQRFEDILGELIEGIWLVGCILLALAGQTIRVYTVGHVPFGTSGRNTREQRAEALNTSGMYSACRHPLYLANFLVFLGILLAVKVWWFVAIGSMAFWIYYERIMAAEAAFLHGKFGEDYRKWSAFTPLFIPSFRFWRRPELPFSWKTVLRREPYGYFAIACAFFAIETISDIVIEREDIRVWLREDIGWVVFIAILGLAFMVLRTLKKRTSLFSVDR
ncbi:MAG: isoprenylcysteine carboxylmethyltransferase family protein [Pirellulales bacterium]|nr:isoprenylcysteine carboxylmethyltransferase family protein [Pirellulales bacterium]